MQYIKTKNLTQKKQVLCGLRGIFLLFSCQTPAQMAREENLQGMKEYQRKIDALMEIYSVAPAFIPTIKKAVCLRGIQMNPYCAAPMLEATQEETEKIRAILQDAGLH